jgi:hypothetical protein
MAQHMFHSVVSAGAAMALDIAAHLRALREDEEAAAHERCRGGSRRSDRDPERPPTDRKRDAGT